MPIATDDMLSKIKDRQWALADIDWDWPPGEIEVCGGNMMVRVEALRQVGGYSTTILAGEDFDLCLRMRKAGWRVLRVAAEMARHDMAMTRFGQWWRRSVHTGYAYGEGVARHGGPPGRHFVRPCLRALFSE